MTGGLTSWSIYKIAIVIDGLPNVTCVCSCDSMITLPASTIYKKRDTNNLESTYNWLKKLRISGTR